MDKVDVIRRLREKEIKWPIIAYSLRLSESAAKMALKRANDILELGEVPVIKKSKFKTPILLKLKELARNNKKLSIRDLEGELTKIFPGESVPSKSKIQDILNESGFKMIKLLKKTLIFPRNQLKRVEFCNEYLNYGPAFWDTVIWSDETSVRQRPQGKELVVRVHSSNLSDFAEVNPQIHSGGFSVMFWGCFSKLGLGPLVVIDGTMNSEKYIELLNDYVLPELNAAGRPMIFMQDNAPCHTARIVMDFFNEKNIETLKWPPQSPDMNPIENLWAIIKAKRQKIYGIPKTKDDLVEQIFDIWNNIDPKVVENLANSANNRVSEVLRLKGKVSKY